MKMTQNILINELNNKPNANKNFIPYEKFCQLINDVNEDKIQNVKIEFNMKNNPYVINMRRYIKNLNINIQNYWHILIKEKYICLNLNLYNSLKMEV